MFKIILFKIILFYILENEKYTQVVLMNILKLKKSSKFVKSCVSIRV